MSLIGLTAHSSFPVLPERSPPPDYSSANEEEEEDEDEEGEEEGARYRYGVHGSPLRLRQSPINLDQPRSTVNLESPLNFRQSPPRLPSNHQNGNGSVLSCPAPPDFPAPACPERPDEEEVWPEPEPPTPEFTGQSNGYCSGDWDCSSTSSSPLPCPPTPTLPLPAGGHAGAPCPEHVHTFGDLRPWEWAAPHALHKAHNKVASSNVLVEKMKKSEREVIQDWLENIFKSWEKTNDLEVTLFKFTPLKRGDASLVKNGGPGLQMIQGGEGQEGAGEPPLAILKSADIRALVKGVEVDYSVIIKVLPTDDSSRYRVKHKFRQLLKFSKEVQVYMKIIKCMYIFDEKRYTSAIVDPPVPKLYFAQMDALNDCLVIENLANDGFVKYDEKFPGQRTLADIDHCRVVLRALAHFHAYSTVIQRDSEEPLLELWPFAVEAANFKETFRDRMRPVKQQLCQYLMWRKSRPDNIKVTEETEEKVENVLQDLFWKLVELRIPPENERMTVLIHGAACLDNIMFSYDQLSGRPNQAKLVDFSRVAVSSPVIDVSDFLYSSVHPGLISEHYVTLLQAYHTAHLEAIKGFGMHGYEIDFEVLVQEYQERIDYGVMNSCLVKPALYLVQRTSPRVRLAEVMAEPKKEHESPKDLRIDSSCLPLDLRLCSHLATLSKLCPCPCAFTAQHSVTRDIVTNSREDLTNSVAAAVQGKKKGFGLDCNRGGTNKTAMKRYPPAAMKRILLNLLTSDSGKETEEVEGELKEVENGKENQP